MSAKEQNTLTLTLIDDPPTEERADIATRFQSGVSGNPNGQPIDPRHLIRDALVTVLAQPTRDGSNRTKAERLVDSIISMASNTRKSEGMRLKALEALQGVLGVQLVVTTPQQGVQPNHVGLIVMQNGQQQPINPQPGVGVQDAEVITPTSPIAIPAKNK